MTHIPPLGFERANAGGQQSLVYNPVGLFRRLLRDSQAFGCELICRHEYALINACANYHFTAALTKLSAWKEGNLSGSATRL